MRADARILALYLLLILPGVALSADKYVSIRFKQHPGRSEQALIYSASGMVHRTHRLIPARVDDMIRDIYQRKSRRR